ncbi:MAG TPA: fumarylacetoacetate hydrolase family protein [Bacteroidota bacterium]|nr:fumarylacetoacetate hydrolase family protein [Bacteroidota bacterium]
MTERVQIYGTGQEIEVRKIFCLGKNYAAHAREMKSEVPSSPVVFLKPPTAILADRKDIRIPSLSKEAHHEVELVVAISRDGKNIPARDAYDYVLGYAIGLDMTLRDVQNEAKKKGEPWTVAKGFDTSAPVSAVIPRSMIPDPHALTIRCTVNGKVRQESTTQNMIFSIPATIAFLSSLFTLERGDLIFTGTPEGVGPVHAGDEIRAELVGFASITHTVRTTE